MKYLILLKNLCRCYHVSPPCTTIKKENNNVLHISKLEERIFEYFNHKEMMKGWGYSCDRMLA
jgi:hypothetical protein